MLASYREVLRTPGAKRFSAAAFIARLPMAIVMLAIVLYVSDSTGSFAKAGALAAAFQIAAAAGGLVTSRIMDRRGQRATLPALAVVNVAGLLLFVLSPDSLVLQAIGVVVAGAAYPPMSSVVRSRWAAALTDAPDQLRTGFAWESVLDELIFTIGPLITAVMAVQLGYAWPFVVASVLTVTGCLLLAHEHATQPPIQTERHDLGNALRQKAMWRMPLVGAAFGWVFGSYEVTIVAFASDQGMPGWSGLVIGLWAAGSAVGGLWFGSRAWKSSLQRHLIVCTFILGLVLIPAIFVESVQVLAVTTFIAGAAISPGLISTYALVERLAPAVLLTESLTWTNSGMILGYAAGTSLSGLFIDSLGTSVSFILPVLGAWVATLLALGPTLAARATPVIP
ncbi:MAG: MFS transporter [Actinomycetota bacterium]|nr:MFS transporter [Actinomycetota bacterium]